MKGKDIVQSISIGVQNYLPYLSSVLDPFLQQNPVWQGVFYSAIGLFGIYMAYNQEEVNEITKFIKEHPKEFREEIVQSREFRKGFLLFTEQYLKQRIEEKKKILKRILLGYTLADNKTDYELERFNDCLTRMTVPTLQFVIFLKTTIIPTLKEQYSDDLARQKHPQSDRSDEWWWNDKLIKVSIGSPIQDWLHKDYSPSSQKVKDDYGIKQNEGWTGDLEHRAQTRETDKGNDVNEKMIELVTLGILRTQTGGASWGGGEGTDYHLTTFGLNFIKQIDDVV